MGKKRKQFYARSHDHHQKRGKYENYIGKLEIGMCGMLITHDRGKESFCRNDAFQLFNYFADEWYGEVDKSKVVAKLSTMENDPKDVESDVHEDDIDAALSKEVSEMKHDVLSRSNSHQRFAAVKSGCNNIIFIKTVGIKPSEFIQRVVETIEKNKDNIAVARHILRIHPVDVTCKAHLVDIKRQAENYLPSAFEAYLSKCVESDEVPKQFNILYRGRNNDHLHMHDVVDVISCATTDSCPLWRYNCRYDQLHLLVDVIKNVCTMSLVSNYIKYKKFNARELFFSKENISQTSLTEEEKLS